MRAWGCYSIVFWVGGEYESTWQCWDHAVTHAVAYQKAKYWSEEYWWVDWGYTPGFYPVYGQMELFVYMRL